VRPPDPILMIGRRRPRRRPMYQVTSELGRKHLEYLLDQVVLVRGPASAQALSQAVAGIAVAKVYDRGGYIVHAASAMQTAPSLQVIYGFLGMALLIALFGIATHHLAERLRTHQGVRAARSGRRHDQADPLDCALGGGHHRATGRTAWHGRRRRHHGAAARRHR